MADELRIEHYKALKEEHRQYLFHVQQLWTYKLSALGVIIVAAILNDKIITINGVNTQLIASVGVISLPVLSFLIDLKALEVGLHVKLISRHLQRNFSDIPEIKKWEEGLWSSNYSRNRTFLTVFAALGTSLVVLGISAWMIYKINRDWMVYMEWGILLSLITIMLIGIRVFPKLGLTIGKNPKEKISENDPKE
jgi:hypothetical protein